MFSQKRQQDSPDLRTIEGNWGFTIKIDPVQYIKDININLCRFSASINEPLNPK